MRGAVVRIFHETPTKISRMELRQPRLRALFISHPYAPDVEPIQAFEQEVRDSDPMMRTQYDREGHRPSLIWICDFTRGVSFQARVHGQYERARVEWKTK